MKGTVFALIAAGAAVAGVAAETYTIDSRHTYPVFEVSHLGFSTQRGRFNKSSGEIVLDRAARKGSLNVTVDAASIDMGDPEWDEHMKSADFFDVEKYPTITFKSDKLLFDGDKPSGAEGTLTLLGVSRPVKATVTRFNCGVHPMSKKPTCGADVSVSIRRSEFGMKEMIPAVGDEVRIIVPVEAYRE